MIKLILRLYTHVRTHFFQTMILTAAVGALIKGYIQSDPAYFRTAIILVSIYGSLVEIKEKL